MTSDTAAAVFTGVVVVTTLAIAWWSDRENKRLLYQPQEGGTTKSEKTK